MKIADYPPQEPLSPLGRAYHERVLAAGEAVVSTEFVYGDDAWQRLNVHTPTRANGDVLLFLHGGGWTSGYKEWLDFMASALNAEGVTFITAGYRLAPQHLFPAGFDDAASAVAWIHRHIAAHGGDPRRLFVGGHSAGGHYAALLAATGHWRTRHGLGADAIRGCLPVSGVYRFDDKSGLTVRPRFLGPPAAAGDMDTALAASPLLCIEPDIAPPFLLSWGSRDFAHLIAQARQMADALRATSVPADTFVLEDCDHFEASLACGDARSGWPARAAAWMQALRSHPIHPQGDTS